MPEFQAFKRLVEARAGIEPAHTGFADQCITTLLPRHARKRPEGRARRGIVKGRDDRKPEEFKVSGLKFQVVPECGGASSWDSSGR